MSRYTSQRHGLRCPECAGKTTRVRRSWLDKLRGLAGMSTARFQCRQERCGWKALMRRDGASWVPSGPWLAPLLRKLRPALVAVAGVSVAATGWAVWRHQQPPAIQFVDVGPRQVARGVSYDGDALPADHPVLVKAALRSPENAVALAPGASPDPSTHAALPPRSQTRAPLAMRRHCSWGQPGRSPYQGTVEQALTSAHLPQEVVIQFAADIAARRSVDRVRIHNDAIVAERSGRRFDHQHVAMTYGMTLCADTRVNFKAGHIERADLFEARAADGRKFAVMVPDVCGNVSVLAETADADDSAGDAGAGDGTVRSRLPDELIYRDSGQQAGPRNASVQQVPEPSTLACVLAGLALAAGLARRRK